MRTDIKAFIKVLDIKERTNISKLLESNGYTRLDTSIEDKAGYFIVNQGYYQQTNVRGLRAFLEHNKDAIDIALIVENDKLRIPAFTRLVEATDESPIGEFVKIKLDIYSFAKGDYICAGATSKMDAALYAELDLQLYHSLKYGDSQLPTG